MGYIGGGRFEDSSISCGAGTGTVVVAEDSGECRGGVFDEPRDVVRESMVDAVAAVTEA